MWRKVDFTDSGREFLREMILYWIFNGFIEDYEFKVEHSYENATKNKRRDIIPLYYVNKDSCQNDFFL